MGEREIKTIEVDGYKAQIYKSPFNVQHFPHPLMFVGHKIWFNYATIAIDSIKFGTVKVPFGVMKEFVEILTIARDDSKNNEQIIEMRDMYDDNIRYTIFCCKNTSLDKVDITVNISEYPKLRLEFNMSESFTKDEVNILIAYLSGKEIDFT